MNDVRGAGYAMGTDERVSVFIGSSAEGIYVARNIQAQFEHDDKIDCILWEHGVFKVSLTAIESLEESVASFDFAILLLTPNDLEISRGEISKSIRDNVVFEFGFFMGALGRRRVFGIRPRGVMKLPSDLSGLTFVDYDPSRFIQYPNAALGPACNRIREEIMRCGRRFK